MDISQIIREHRKAARLTQLELATLAGVGKTAVFDVEAGKRTIRYDTLERILIALNITIRFESPLLNAGSAGVKE